uniref:Serine protease inhibitor n=1 Tax=Steinernema glaseri TaxID=37863 RepID=A0A1I7ZW58_9BILA
MRTYILLLALVAAIVLSAPERLNVCVINLDHEPCSNEFPFCRILDGLWECCIDEAAGTTPCPSVTTKLA